MVLGAFLLLHNAIANNSDNDSTNHKKSIISILYEQHCKLESVVILQRKALCHVTTLKYCYGTCTQ